MADPTSERIAPFYTAVDNNVIEPHDHECHICLESLLPDPETKKSPKQGPPVRLSCAHIFGETCISHWLMFHRTCPSCRVPVQEVQSPGLDGWRKDRQSVLHDLRCRSPGFLRLLKIHVLLTLAKDWKC